MDAIQKYIFFGILFGSQLLINPWLGTDVFEFPKLLVLIVGVSFLTIANIVDISFGKKPAPRLPHSFLFFLCLLFFGEILGLMFSSNPAVSLSGRSMRYQGFLTQAYYLLLTLNVAYCTARWRERASARFGKVFALLLAGIALLAVLPYTFPMVWPFYFFTPAFFDGRVFGTFGNPNYLAASLIGLLPFLALQGPKNAFLRATAMTLVVITLFLTGSRSAWLSASIAFGIAGILDALRHRRLKILGALGAVLATTLFLLIFKTALAPHLPQTARLSLDTEKSFSIATRVHLWKAGLKMFLERPLVGFGQEMVRGNIEPSLPFHLRENEIFFIDRIHSEPLEILVTAGIFGFIGYMGLFGAAFLRAGRSLWKTRDAFLLSTAIGLASLFLFHGLNFATISSNVLLYAFMGFIYGIPLTYNLPPAMLEPQRHT